MRQIILQLSLVVFICSCKKSTEPKQDDKVPVKYFLSEQDKEVFKGFSNNLDIQFTNASNEVLIFHADSVSIIRKKRAASPDKGESMQVMYNCLSTYLANYFIDCYITARPDTLTDLMILFSTGPYGPQKTNDWALSYFFLEPKNLTTLDTVKNGTVINQKFYDSLVLGGVKFYKVLQGDRIVVNLANEQTLKCYFTVPQGLVAFQNNDGKLWVRK
jgi:hypothetical protein